MTCTAKDSNFLFQHVCQVLVSADGYLIAEEDVDPSIMDARLVNKVMNTLQDAMESQQRKHDEEITSIHDTILTQQRHYDTELTSLKQELKVTKQQHDAELTSLKYKLTTAQGNNNEGLC